jgi:copper chaperone CopZ
MRKILLLSVAVFSLPAFSAGTKITMVVEGMSCASCAASIEKELRKHPEVDAVEISVRKKKVTVAFKEGKSLAAQEIQKDIEVAGYRATPEATPTK